MPEDNDLFPGKAGQDLDTVKDAAERVSASVSLALDAIDDLDLLRVDTEGADVVDSASLAEGVAAPPRADAVEYAAAVEAAETAPYPEALADNYSATAGQAAAETVAAGAAAGAAALAGPCH